MKTAFVSFALFLAASTGATPTTSMRSADMEDWKYSVGWDGVTLPASDIGLPTSANGSAHDLEKRTVGGVYICTDINWGGKCGYAVQPLNKCIVLGSDWNKQISSFGPDPCTGCNAYSSNNCQYTGAPTPAPGPLWYFDYPGDATGGLGTDNPWNDQISSFICSAFSTC